MAKETIKRYNQGEDARWYAGTVKPELVGIGATKSEDYVPNDTSNGVCFALVTLWIIKRYSGRHFWSSIRGAGPHIIKIKELQRAQKGDSHVSFILMDKEITGATDATRLSKYLMEKGTKFNLNGYYYINLSGIFRGATGRSGHAIGAHINAAGKCRYFDPNCGEFEFDSPAELLEGISERVRHYAVRDLKIQWCCWG